MTNREKILKSSEYDTLVKMNEYLLEYEGTCMCVLDVLNGRKTPCASDSDCEECIAKWLNEEAE